jgi:hypothetical protein
MLVDRNKDPSTAWKGTLMSTTLTIDCDQCTLRHTNACDGCLVAFVLDRDPDDAVVIDVQEARAVRMLERAGLVPSLRFHEKVS